MSYIYPVIGTIIGAIFAGFPGCLLGGFAGWVIGNSFALHNRISRLENEVARLAQAPARPTAEPASPEAEEVDFEAAVAEAAQAQAAQAQAAQAQAQAQAPAAHAQAAHGQAARAQATVGATAHQSAQVRQARLQPNSERSRQERAQTTSESGPLFDAIASFFTGGNLLVKSGIIILFFGVSFLVKYAAQHGMFPIELRLACCALGGAALLATGWRLRLRRPEYSLTLQGGGIGVLYLTCYAAFRLYHLIPDVPAFVLLFALSLLCGALAVIQDSRTLALFGISGGFLAPLLASTGQGSHLFVFGYYVVLNAGIIGIAWFKSWRSLNLAGFIFTFLISATWGAEYYRPAYFSSTEPFLILFFLMYVGVALLFALRQPPELKGYLDGTIIFGTPVVSFALQALLVADYRYGLAWSALAAGLFYIVLSLVVARQRELAQLADAFRAFGIIFLTLTVPLACDGRWTAAAWALEGAAIAWVGIRQDRPIARTFGYLLQACAGIAFSCEIARPAGPLPVLNIFYLGCLLISLAGLWTSYSLYRESENVDPWEYILSQLLIAWGLFWWLGGGLYEIERHVSASYLEGIQLVFISVTCLICHLLERRLSWQPMTWPALAIVPALWCFSFLALSAHPLENGCWLAWPVAFALLYHILYLRDEEMPEILPFLHAGALWLFAVLASWELCWQILKLTDSDGSWLTIGSGIVPVIILFSLVRWGDLLTWPVGRHLRTYLWLAAVPLAVWSWIWCIFANITDRGEPFGMVWLPLLNPLDLAVLLCLAALLFWYRRVQELPTKWSEAVQGAEVSAAYEVTVFIWLNAILVRGLHHWGGIPFDAVSMFHSRLAQTSFAVFWSLLALCAMILATRHAMRALWIAGAGLLGAVVVKLFLIDLAGHGSIERIVSFVAVGLLLLAIGWWSPVPPRAGR